jgi:CHAT domain-containing protein
MLQASSAYQFDGQRFLKSAVLRRAYDALIGPAASQVAAATHVIVVPHGPLHQLPFAALLDAAGQPLLDRVAHLSYAPSATVLMLGRTDDRAGAQRACLALGYDGGDERRLRHTEAEAATIARLCHGDAWISGDLVRERLTREAGQYRWLHLACHGEFNLADPLSSQLEIGPAERLSAADVLADLKLSAELVTLSACRSGVSLVLRGDEPIGLVRAFLSAGARAVLVTLWEVEDRSARLLIESFYQDLLAGAEPAAALRASQQRLRQLTIADMRAQMSEWGEPDADLPADDEARPYADPAFWGAYALIRTL